MVIFETFEWSCEYIYIYIYIYCNQAIFGFITITLIFNLSLSLSLFLSLSLSFSLCRFFFRSGNIETNGDKFYNTTVEVLPNDVGALGTSLMLRLRE